MDVACGMLVYATGGPRRRPARLRETPEDFQVDEVLDMAEVSAVRTEEFSIPVYKLSKRGTDTPHAVAALSEALKSNVNFAGMKDSKAVTTQYVSARSRRASDPAQVKGERFGAERAGYLRRPVTRGMMAGNKFRIAVSTEEDLAESTSEAFEACARRQVPNFFGYQRFGLRGMVNHRVGKAILRRDFKAAIDLLLGEPREGEKGPASNARTLAREGRYPEAATTFTPRQDIERRVAIHLTTKPGDFQGALRRVPMTPRRLFVQAYQSFLYNRTLERGVGSRPGHR